MYPFTMLDSQFFFPVDEPVILKSGSDQFFPIDELFGVIRCKITPPDDLYFPMLPMIGTWTTFEVQFAVQNSYVMNEIFEQHHFPERSNTLFKEYNDI